MNERREHMRVDLSLPVLCEPALGDAFGGVVANLGLGGACIEGSEAPPTGTELFIAARLPGMPDLSRLPASVKWVRGREFGVLFGPLGAPVARRIAEMMADAMRLRSQLSAPS